MNQPQPGDEITANILIGNGAEKSRRVKVLGAGPWGLRVEMVDGAPEVQLPAGVQTILAWSRVA